jgi:hypothetical protein
MDVIESQSWRSDLFTRLALARATDSLSYTTSLDYHSATQVYQRYVEGVLALALPYNLPSPSPEPVPKEIRAAQLHFSTPSKESQSSSAESTRDYDTSSM